MHIVNQSGVKFTNKYLTWFRCLGLEDHGLGEGTNGGKKAARSEVRELQQIRRCIDAAERCEQQEQAPSLKNQIKQNMEL